MNIALHKRGFTLIEVLVVIAIIGILSAVLFSNFGEARVDSKNKAMKSEIKEVQLALELYKAQNGQYPDAPSSGACGSSEAGVTTAQSATCGLLEYITGLTPDFIAELPSHTDSANPACNIIYSVENTSFSWYKLSAVNCHGGADSVDEGVQDFDEFARCLTSCGGTMCTATTSAAFYETYSVYSSGGECI